MTPIQAQIAAALHFIDGIAAMTKAAEKGLVEADVRTPDHRKYLFRFHEQTIDEARKAKAALTAAAEVGEHNPINIYNTVYQEAVERCAQVVEQWMNRPISVNEIARAIRTLKAK